MVDDVQFNGRMFGSKTGWIDILTSKFFTEWVKDDLLQYKKPILDLTVESKEKERSSQIPKYLLILTNWISEPSIEEILRWRSVCVKLRLNVMHFVLVVCKRR